MSTAVNLVLFEPEIPQNTGNIARTCLALGAGLHLIEPLGFLVSDRHLKRAGMDYWHRVAPRRHTSWEAFLETLPPHSRLLLLSTRGQARLDTLERDLVSTPLYLVLGPESRGLPDKLLAQHPATTCRLPMNADTRSSTWRWLLPSLSTRSRACVVFPGFHDQDRKGMEPRIDTNSSQEQPEQPAAYNSLNSRASREGAKPRRKTKKGKQPFFFHRLEGRLQGRFLGP